MMPFSAAPIGNEPFRNPSLEGPGHGFQEVWYLKLNAPADGRALWLRFTLLVRSDGAKRIAETWAISFRRTEWAIEKVALKCTRKLESFEQRPGAGFEGFRIGDCEFSDQSTRGQIERDGQSIRWELHMTPARPLAFNFVPRSLARRGVIKNAAQTVFEDLRFNGWSEVNGDRFEWRDAPGMQGHLAGARNGHSWAWGHCNTFVDEQGNPTDCLWDGLRARARLGKHRRTPYLTSMLIVFEGREYRFNRTWQVFRSPSRYDMNGWTFEAKEGDVSFRGSVRAAANQFAGVAYEDTDGSALYCYNSKISDMTLEVWRAGRMERTLTAAGSVAFEVVTREKRTNIPLLL